MRFDIITIFPKILDSYFSESILRRAEEKRLIKIATHNLRDFTNERHNKVDDSPYGGGPGMVIQLAPVYKAVKFARSKVPPKARLAIGGKGQRSKVRTILFSTRGKVFDAATARRLVKYDQLIFICGRYEGVDERVAQHVADEEISIGDFVLSGGELPAAVVIEAVARQIPGVLGKYESLEEVKGSYPVYTRPEVFIPKKGARAWKVPKVLLGGDHKKIDAWRRSKQ
ncbi:MAG: tRNA (guanosine(37)-N1)-methyltransferase TrmD [Candidatus Harrisonbacteria bacterium]|nr:tRNA (guanosine(37)-N1)-methyltransferase TrmD [Candidatus Harrisonbacteria bacterium]